jgi:hypothetical protein
MRNSLVRHSTPFRPDTLKCEGARPRACLSRYSIDRAGKGFPGVTLPADGGPVPPSRRHLAWYYSKGIIVLFWRRHKPKIGSFSLEQRGDRGGFCGRRHEDRRQDMCSVLPVEAGVIRQPSGHRNRLALLKRARVRRFGFGSGRSGDRSREAGKLGNDKRARDRLWRSERRRVGSTDQWTRLSGRHQNAARTHGVPNKDRRVARSNIDAVCRCWRAQLVCPISRPAL